MTDAKTDVTARFWESINGDADHAEDCLVRDIADALEEYAEQDVDGQIDGAYITNTGDEKPVPFTVRLPDGTEEKWEVYGEYEIIFHARRVKDPG